MNWQAISFDWNHVRAFLATVEEGSLSAAARVTQQTQPTLGRQISALEQELGVTLFERSGRSLTLTQPGVELLDHVRSMAEAATRISLTASGQSQAIDGTVRITASDVMCAHALPRALLRLADIAPLLQVDLLATNDVSDLLQREADIAIRHVRPDQPDLIARLLGEQTGHLFATPDYLRRYGHPHSLADLSSHRFIGMGDNLRMVEHLKPFGVFLTAENFKTGSAAGTVAWELAKRGLGIGIMSDEVGCATPEMQCLLPDLLTVTFPVWLVTHRELHTSRRIRLVFDVLAEVLTTKNAAP